MKNLKKHILRSLMGIAGLLTFTACYGPAEPLPEPLPDRESHKEPIEETNNEMSVETEAELDVTAEL